MLQSKGVLNDIPIKNKGSSQKIWPFFMYQRDDHDTEELNTNRANNVTIRRLRHDGNYFTDLGSTECFHCAIGPVLNIAQIFGIFPVSGVRSSSPTKLQFKVFSFLTIYSGFIAVMMFITTMISIVYMVKILNTDIFHTRGGIGTATVGAVFYGNSLLGSILFFWLSSRWIPLQCEWRVMEQYMDSNSSETPRLRWKFFLISSVVMLLALIEHILSVFNNIEGYDWNGSNSTFRNFLEIYSLRSHAFIFNILDYNFTFGLYIFVVSKLATFTWNFTDLFIMLVATGLAERYKTLNKKLAITVTKYRATFDWRELREDYAILSCVVKKVDEQLSPIILLSFANNLYFICLQLMNGLSTSDDSMLRAVYFFGSFAFLIGRTCAVTLLTARIHDQSKEALPYLYNCSASSYSVETQRLQYQLATDDVALTGLRFFSITRNFMLAVAGAIMTYEVVFLQFSGSK
ncbi:PREDICTED: gustatory receptor for sugar taste 64f-like [Habropoda laboriosa]|nr:PREDICTED: gustatory receptor for sugar taste 64f-like [Habropoda laboriosa]